MNRLALLLVCFSLWDPASACANPTFASGLSSLKEISNQLGAGSPDAPIINTPFVTNGQEESLDLEAYLQSGAYYCADTSAQIILASAKSKSSKRGRSRRGCGCASGCGMDQSGLQPIIKKFVAAAGQIGIRPVSCIRSQACQNRLRACFERCGQRGRAAKNSLHSDGRACDFSRRDGRRLTALKKKTGLPINRLSHGREGGGLHEYQ